MSILNNNIKMEAEALVRSSSRDRLTSPTISSSANINKSLSKMEKTGNDELVQEVTSGLNNNLINHKSNGIKGGLAGGNENRHLNGSGTGGVLPSFSDILWCTDVDGDVMSSTLDSTLPSSLPLTEESLDDLSDIVGPELADLLTVQMLLTLQDPHLRLW